MWVWFFGLSISIFLIFRELEFSAGVSLIPLIVLSFFACLEFIFRVFKFPKCSQWREWINTGFLADLSIALVVLVALARKRLCKNFDCLEKPKYNRLKEEKVDTNIEQGVTNDE